jgi:hypothetical protein
MCGLQQVEVGQITVVEGTSDHVTLHTETKIHNPSPITIQLGTVHFYLYHDSQPVGRLTLPQSQIHPGENYMKAICHYAPSDRASHRLAGRHLLSQYLAGLPSTVQIRGFPGSCKDCETGGGNFFAPAVATMQITTKMPGLDQRLLKEARLLLFQTNPVTRTAPASLLMLNPFDVPVELHSMDGVVTLMQADEMTGETTRLEVGSIQVNLEPAWVLPPKEEYLSEPVGMKVKLGMGAVNALVKVATQKLVVDVEAVLGCRIGEYATEVNYQQFDVPVTLG